MRLTRFKYFLPTWNQLLQIGLLTILCFSASKPVFAEDLSVPELRVTANPLEPTLSSYGQSVSLLEGENLDRRKQATLGETLGRLPGVSSSYFGPGASRPIIRGNDAERIKILKNGVSTFDISNLGEDHAVAIDPYQSTQIEVLRGPETLLYGSSAIGGLVNSTDGSIAKTPIGKPISSDFLIQQGSVDDELSGAGTLEGQIEQFNWHLSGFHRKTNDVDIPGNSESQRLIDFEQSLEESHDEQEHAEEEEFHQTEGEGKVENTATNTRGFTAGGSFIAENGSFIGASVTGFKSRYGIPGHTHGHEDGHGEEEHHGEFENVAHSDEIISEEHSEESESGPKAKLEQIRVDVRGEVVKPTLSLKKVSLRAGASNYNHKEIEGEEVALDFENDAFEIRTDVLHEPVFGALEGVVGLQLQYSDFVARGEEAFLPSAKTTSPAAFFYEKLPLTTLLDFQFGGRYEHVAVDPEGFASRSFDPVSVSTGLVLDPLGGEEYTVGLTVSYAERAPSNAELFSNGAHLARQIVEIGNSELSNERSVGVDLSAKGNVGRFRPSASVFIQQYDDYINLSSQGVIDEGLPVFGYEDVRARLWGFEVESVFDVFEVAGHDLDFEAQFDFVQGKNLSNSEALPRITPPRTIVAARHDWADRIISRIEGVFVQEQTRLAEFEIPTSGYELLNASMEFRISKQAESLPEVSLFVLGSNLTDREARVHSSFVKDLVPLPGRSILVGLKGSF